MKKRYCVDISPLILAATLTAILDRRPAAGGACHAGLTELTDSLKELTDIFQGIHSFLSGVSFLSETIGLGTILLFLAVIIFSAGYSAIGLPKGKAAFFTSLVTADLLWISWKAAFKAPLTDYLSAMVKSNLIVLCPLVIAALISRAAPGLLRKIRSGASFLFHRNNSLGQREAAALCEECQTRGARLTRAITADILAAGGPGKPVSLSGETRELTEELGETVEKIGSAARMPKSL